MIKIGETRPSKIMVGADAVSKVYRGAELVWQALVNLWTDVITDNKYHNNNGVQANGTQGDIFERIYRFPTQAGKIYKCVWTDADNMSVEIDSAESDRGQHFVNFRLYET